MSNTDHKTPYLVHDSRLPIAGQPQKAVVFAHGIFSSHATFNPLREQLANDPALADWRFHCFDYDFNQSIPLSGLQLAEALRGEFSDGDEVSLVCHSMGGLVGRLALLQQGDVLPFVRRLIMLGTPNYGTLHSARLAILAHAMRSSMGFLWAVCSRKTGIKELTEVDKVIAPFLTPQAIGRTAHVEYITIPGMYFHEDREWLRWGPRDTSVGLKALNLAMEFSAAFPLARVGLRQPHDGIVEESSVCLAPEIASRFSERPLPSDGGTTDSRYLHILHPDYREVDHVTIQKADRTAHLLKELLCSKSAERWRHSTRSKHEPYHFKPNHS